MSRIRTDLIIALVGGIIVTVAMHYLVRTTFDMNNFTVSGSCGFPFPTAGYSQTAGEAPIYRFFPLGIVANVLLNATIVFAVLRFVSTRATSDKPTGPAPPDR